MSPTTRARRTSRWRGAAAALAAAGVLAASAALAQERPDVFYVVSRLSPDVPAEALPPPARGPYRRMLRVDRELRRLRFVRDFARRQALAARLDGLAQRDEQALERILARGELDAAGWIVLGEVRTSIAARRLLAAYEAHEADPETAPETVPDYERSIAAFRHAAALARDARMGAWARYLEAWCLLEMGRTAEAGTALRIAAHAAPPELRAEALFRLGDLAFDDADYDVASGWYARAEDPAPPRLRPLVVYRLAWACFFAGRLGRVHDAIGRLPAGAPAEIVEDLARLRSLATP